MAIKSFNNIISKAPGAKFPIEKNRYLMYVSLTCPFTQRALIARRLKGLEEYFPLVHTHFSTGPKGWRFATKEELASVPKGDIKYGSAEPLYGLERLSELYHKADPEYEGRWTVPVIFDKKEETIVNNESGEMVRIYNTEFNEHLAEKYAQIDLYPEILRDDIEAFNTQYANPITSGWVKAVYASNQESFEKGLKAVLEKLSALDQHFAESQKKGLLFLVGSQVTEADLKLFTPIVRLGRIYYYDETVKPISIAKDYPNVHRWLKHLWLIPAFKDTTDFGQLTDFSEDRYGKKLSRSFEASLDLD